MSGFADMTTGDIIDTVNTTVDRNIGSTNESLLLDTMIKLQLSQCYLLAMLVDRVDELLEHITEDQS